MQDADALGVPRAADQPGVRRMNLGLVLRQLRDHGPRTRARIAAELGLNRSAASSLVAELEDRGLVRAAGAERGSVGRPGTSVELDGTRVCGIGAELNVDHLATIALDMSGHTLAERRLSRSPATGNHPTEVLGQLAGLIEQTVEEAVARGAQPIGLTVGVAGLVDREHDVLAIGPNLGWTDVPVGQLLRDRLAPAFPVALDNEGNLAATAEVVAGDPTRKDVLVVFGEVGVGGGIVAGGRLLRGARGYAGELGHMTVDPGGRRCGCGRIGCWETVIGLRALLDAAADTDDPVRDPALSLEQRMDEINRRAALGDGRTRAALDRIGSWVGTGAALLANALDPAAVVLSGYFAEVGEYLRPAVEQQLEAGVLTPRGAGPRVELSTLGFTAAVRGAAIASMERVFADPSLVDRPPRRTALAHGASGGPR